MKIDRVVNLPSAAAPTSSATSAGGPVIRDRRVGSDVGREGRVVHRPVAAVRGRRALVVVTVVAWLRLLLLLLDEPRA